MLVDKGWVAELLERLTEYAAAVTRGNDRAGGNKLHDRCVAAILATGTAPADCPKD